MADLRRLKKELTDLCELLTELFPQPSGTKNLTTNDGLRGHHAAKGPHGLLVETHFPQSIRPAVGAGVGGSRLGIGWRRIGCDERTSSGSRICRRHSSVVGEHRIAGVGKRFSVCVKS